MAKAFEGMEKALPEFDSEPGQPRVLDAPWTWLFLVGLHPCRARLRFTRQRHCTLTTAQEAVPREIHEIRG